MSSVWKAGNNAPEFETLSENKKTDVLIIGAGIAGILTAHRLKTLGVDCTVIDQGAILGGVTENTTAKITLLHGLIYDKLIKQIGKENAALYLAAQRKAQLEYEGLAKKIPCDYEKRDAFVYSTSDRHIIEREAMALGALGVSADVASCSEIPVKTVGAVRVKEEAQFNPLKLLYALASELPIYENTKAVRIMPKRVITDRGEIFYKKLLIATHFPILNKHGGYFLKLYQHRSYVIALEGAQKLSGMYVDESLSGMSFRSYKNLLLVGGGGHRTGKPGTAWRELEDFVRDNYKGAREVGRFAAQDCMSLDGIPYIGRYSPLSKNIFVATGFNKWGMTSSMVAADILSDLVCERENEYAHVFSPSRSILHPQLFVNIFESAVNLLTPTAPRCPHLGCALKYNKAEHSWDCPCHGSRFTESGEILDNPAIKARKM